MALRDPETESGGMMTAKPFLRWVGGKRLLLPVLDASLPLKLKRGEITAYVDPFAGGGAMLFHLMRHYPSIRTAVINDINPELMLTYRAVRDHPEALIRRLGKLQRRYDSLPTMEAKEALFLRMRRTFNERRRHD